MTLFFIVLGILGVCSILLKVISPYRLDEHKCPRDGCKNPVTGPMVSSNVCERCKTADSCATD